MHNTSPLLAPRGEADFDFYSYNPSAVAGWIFVILFALGGIIHLAYFIPYRSWFFVPFILGCAAEAGGYYGRASAHNARRAGTPYLLQLFLLIGAVPLLSATVYMTLSRLAKALHATQYSLVRISWVSKIYIVIDVACVVLQVMGTVTMAYGGAGEQGKAVKLVAGGLIFQLVAFVFFVGLAWGIHARLNRSPTPVSTHVAWRKYFWVLYGASMLVLVRNSVRVAEFLQGGGGEVASHEAYLYVFDAAPMVLVVGMMTVVFPGALTKKARLVAEDGGEDVPLVVK